MLRSMTGYGRGEYGEDDVHFSVEIKSVNHRYCDISVRMPRLISVLEHRVREYAKTFVSRGKIDIYINYDSFGQDVGVEVDTSLVNSYIECLNIIRNDFSIKGDISLSLLTRFPEILKVERIEKEEEVLWRVLKKALEDAFRVFIEMKEREGERLFTDLCAKIEDIQDMVEQIDIISQDTVKLYMVKLQEKVQNLIDGMDIDENRLLTEIAIIADKSSIDEEIVRLKSHILEFEKTMDDRTMSGKKLDFIIQEMNREVNTIGSKAADLDIINNVVNIKTEIEKIREQVQNIE